MYVLNFELRFGSKCLYLLRHLTCPHFHKYIIFLRQALVLLRLAFSSLGSQGDFGLLYLNCSKEADLLENLGWWLSGGWEGAGL